MRSTQPRPRRPLAAISALALALSGVLLTSAPAAATSSLVSNTDDDGPGSLRQAIINANSDTSADTIVINANGTISLASSLPAITEPVTIVGPGPANLTIDANSHDAFVVAAPVEVSISELTITDAGSTSFIGAIHNAGGSLALWDIEVNNSWQGLSLTSGTVDATSVSLLNNTDIGALLDLSAGASTLNNLTVSGNGGTGNSGLVLYLQNDATLTAADTIVSDNATGGMSIYASGNSSVTFTDTQLNRNGPVNSGVGLYAEFSDDAQGHFTGTTANNNGWEGIHVELDNRTIVTFTDTTANDNASDGFDGEALKHAQLSLTSTTTSDNDGEGIEVTARTGANVIIDSATTSGNTDNGLQILSRGEGGVNNDASRVSVSSLTSFNNDAGADVNVSHGGLAEITASVFTANLSRGILIDSGANNGTGSEVRIVATNVIGNGQGTSNGAGIAIERTTDLSIVIFDSTIAHNTGDAGGGIYARLAGTDPSALTIVNSTISDNTAAIGGGMYLRSNSSAPISVHSATFMVNTTTGVAPSSAAIYLQGVDAMFRDSILAGGSAADVDLDGTAVAVFYTSLIQNPSPAAAPLVSNPADDNVVGLDPQLGPLTDNGGLTLTRLPAETSPVVNTGDPEWTDGFITQDQRGEARVSEGRIDIGAVEVQQGLADTGAGDITAVLAGGALLAALGAALLGYRRLKPTPH